jgi:hypothetical protein
MSDLDCDTEMSEQEQQIITSRSHHDGDEKEPARRRSTPSRTVAAARSISYVDPDDLSTDSDDSLESDADQVEVPKQRASTKAAKKQREINKTTQPFACPHCHKKFASLQSVQYHVSNFVCRPAERPGGPVRAGRPRKFLLSEAATCTEEYVNDRTCSDCKGVFASVQSLKIHRST